MNRKLAVSLLSALLYAQGLLCFAAVVTVLFKNHDGIAGHVTTVLSSVSAAVA